MLSENDRRQLGALRVALASFALDLAGIKLKFADIAARGPYTPLP